MLEHNMFVFVSIRYSGRFFICSSHWLLFNFIVRNVICKHILKCVNRKLHLLVGKVVVIVEIQLMLVVLVQPVGKSRSYYCTTTHTIVEVEVVKDSSTDSNLGGGDQ